MNSEPLLSPEMWEHTPAEAQTHIRALEARVAALEAMVLQLREQLQQDSRTSSRPPSSDPPQAANKRPRRERTGRQPGGLSITARECTAIVGNAAQPITGNTTQLDRRQYCSTGRWSPSSC
jgi:Family of unknown function (DUF6444)